MVVNVSVQYNNGFLGDIILLTIFPPREDAHVVGLIPRMKLEEVFLDFHESGIMLDAEWGME